MATSRTRTIPTSWVLSCILLTLMIAEPQLVRGRASSFWSPTTASDFGVPRQNKNVPSILLISMRGGSTEEAELSEEDEEDEIDEEDEEDEIDEDEDEDEIPKKVPKIASQLPVRLIISTNWGNSVVDQTVELTPSRTRDVASLKKSLSKQLLGRPPIVALDLVYEGRSLEDDMIVDELFEDEDDEEEDDEDDEVEEGNEPTRKLTLNLVPPVDPKFATEILPKLKGFLDDDDDFATKTADPDTLTAEEVVDAYYMNQVCMARNAQLLADPNAPSSPLLRLELQEQAKQLRDQLEAETPPDVWEKCLAVPDPSKSGGLQEEWKGQRYRSTKGGVSRQIKTAIQTNMNVVRYSNLLCCLLNRNCQNYPLHELCWIQWCKACVTLLAHTNFLFSLFVPPINCNNRLAKQDWGSAIRLSLVFLFLGYFGGRDSFSRQLLFLGAPLSFGLQARPVKIWFKILFYFMSNPPLILLSFLPAPQQAILSVDLKESLVALYPDDGEALYEALPKAEEVEPTISFGEDVDDEFYNVEDESDEDEQDEDVYDSEEDDEYDESDEE